MIRALGVPIGIAKEIRALLPVWFACVAVAAALALWTPDRQSAAWWLVAHDLVQSLGGLGFLLGPVALGAWAIGHELNHGTLSGILLQPVHRNRLYVRKLVVLVSMALMAWIMLGSVLYVAGAFPFERAYMPIVGDLPLTPIDALSRPFVILPILAGLCLAPWLTMISRSTLAGVVLSLAAPTALWVGLQALAVAVYGADKTATPEAVEFSRALLVRTTVVLAGISVFAGWKTFSGLQVIEKPAPALTLPRWPPPSAWPRTSSRPSPHVLLLRKELRLHAPTFVLSVLYVVGWAGAVAYDRFEPMGAGNAMGAATTFYLCLSALLAGALVSSEERQWGTLQWQLLLPVSARQQWAIKILTAVVLSLFLSVGLPVVLSLITPVLGIRFFVLFDDEHPWMNAALLAMALTCVGVYASSLARSALSALLVAVAIAVASMPVLAEWTRIVRRVLVALLPPFPPANGLHPLERIYPELTIAALALLGLWFGSGNHRFGGITTRRVVGQFGWMLLFDASLWLALFLALQVLPRLRV